MSAGTTAHPTSPIGHRRTLPAVVTFFLHPLTQFKPYCSFRLYVARSDSCVLRPHRCMRKPQFACLLSGSATHVHISITAQRAGTQPVWWCVNRQHSTQHCEEATAIVAQPRHQVYSQSPLHRVERHARQINYLEQGQHKVQVSQLRCLDWLRTAWSATAQWPGSRHALLMTDAKSGTSCCNPA